MIPERVSEPARAPRVIEGDWRGHCCRDLASPPPPLLCASLHLPALRPIFFLPTLLLLLLYLTVIFIHRLIVFGLRRAERERREASKASCSWLAWFRSVWHVRSSLCWAFCAVCVVDSITTPFRRAADCLRLYVAGSFLLFLLLLLLLLFLLLSLLSECLPTTSAAFNLSGGRGPVNCFDLERTLTDLQNGARLRWCWFFSTGFPQLCSALLWLSK